MRMSIRPRHSGVDLSMPEDVLRPHRRWSTGSAAIQRLAGDGRRQVGPMDPYTCTCRDVVDPSRILALELEKNGTLASAPR